MNDERPIIWNFGPHCMSWEGEPRGHDLGAAYNRYMGIVPSEEHWAILHDTDGDGLCDGGTSVWDGGTLICQAGEDLNNNGIIDPGETDPLLADSDGDSFSDILEISQGSNPADPTIYPKVMKLYNDKMITSTGLGADRPALVWASSINSLARCFSPSPRPRRAKTIRAGFCWIFPPIPIPSARCSSRRTANEPSQEVKAAVSSCGTSRRVNA